MDLWSKDARRVGDDSGEGHRIRFVREVLAKVSLGEADAGFVYSTDARTVPGQVTVLKMPAWAQPKVQYGICVVKSSANVAAAQAFIRTVLSKAGQAKLLAAGFLPRVKPKPAP